MPKDPGRFYRPYMRETLCRELNDFFQAYLPEYGSNFDEVRQFAAAIHAKISYIDFMKADATYLPTVDRPKIEDEPPEGFNSWQEALDYLKTPLES